MFSMGELTHEGDFGCLFVIWSCSERENGGAHVTLWNRVKGVTAGGDATEQDSTIRRVAAEQGVAKSLPVSLLFFAPPF